GHRSWEARRRSRRGSAGRCDRTTPRPGGRRVRLGQADGCRDDPADRGVRCPGATVRPASADPGCPGGVPAVRGRVRPRDRHDHGPGQAGVPCGRGPCGHGPPPHRPGRRRLHPSRASGAADPGGGRAALGRYSMTELYQFGFGFGLAWGATQVLPKPLWGLLAARNHRGLTLTTGLGVPLAIASLLPGLIALISAAIGGESVSTFELALLVGCLLVFLAGLIADLIGHGPRGIRAHIGAALRGRLTTGALKIVVILGAAALVASVGVAREPIRILAGVGLGVGLG